MGSPATLTIGRAIWDSFFLERDWPLAASLAMLLLALISLPALLLRVRR
jgi:putrescine transport system permease protein